MLILVSECNVRNMESPITFFFKGYIWTSPYGHLDIMATFFWPGKTAIHYLSN